MTADQLRAAIELLPPGTLLTLPRDELLEALGPQKPPAPPPTPEEWLTAKQTAAILKVSQTWCYDHDKLLGAKHLSRRCVRFSRHAIERFMAKRA